MQKMNNSEFIELLCLNNPEKLKKFLIMHGKQPKAVCPIEFFDKDEYKNNDDEKDNKN